MTHSFNKVATIICIKLSAKNQLHITAEKIMSSRFHQRFADTCTWK